MTATPNGGKPVPSLGVLWFEVLAGPIAWFLHLLLVYGLSWFACITGWAEITLLSFSLVDILMVLTTLVTGGITLTAGLWAWRHLKPNGFGPEERVPDYRSLEDPRARSRFMSLFAVYLNGISLLAIVAQLVPALYLAACD